MIRPALSFSRPAMHRKTVVFPAPDGPKRIVVEAPGGIRSLASIRRPLSNRFSMSAISSKKPYLPVESVNNGKNHERDNEQRGRSDGSLGIIETLHLIVDIYGESLGYAGNVSA